MEKISWKGLAASAAILFIFCTCFIVCSGLAAAAPSVSVGPQTNEYNAGDTFQITVAVNSNTSNLRAVNLQLGYDASVFQVMDITDQNLLGTDALLAPGSGDNGAGSITYGIASTSGVYAPVTGNILTVAFQVKSTAADGLYILDLDATLKDQTNAVIEGVAVTDSTLKIGDSVGQVSDGPKVIVSPVSTSSFAPGDTFLADVKVDSADESLRAIYLQLKYDLSVLQMMNITNKNLLGTSVLVAPGSGDNGAGTTSYGIAVTDGAYIPVDGTLLSIEFKVKADAIDGSTNLDLGNVVLKDQNNVVITEVAVTDASVNVGTSGTDESSGSSDDNGDIAVDDGDSSESDIEGSSDSAESSSVHISGGTVSGEVSGLQSAEVSDKEEGISQSVPEATATVGSGEIEDHATATTASQSHTKIALLGLFLVVVLIGAYIYRSK